MVSAKIRAKVKRSKCWHQRTFKGGNEKPKWKPVSIWREVGGNEHANGRLFQNDFNANVYENVTLTSKNHKEKNLDWASTMLFSWFWKAPPGYPFCLCRARRIMHRVQTHLFTNIIASFDFQVTITGHEKLTEERSKKGPSRTNYPDDFALSMPTYSNNEMHSTSKQHSQSSKVIQKYIQATRKIWKIFPQLRMILSHKAWKIGSSMRKTYPSTVQNPRIWMINQQGFMIQTLKLTIFKKWKFKITKSIR